MPSVGSVVLEARLRHDDGEDVELKARFAAPPSPRRPTGTTKGALAARPWRTMEAVAFAALEWVDWFNNHVLLEPIGNIPPAEAEAQEAPETIAA